MHTINTTYKSKYIVYIIYYILCSILNDHYEELQPLFTLDPLLVFAVAYVCPRCDIVYLCDRIHLPYAIALVNKNISTSSESDFAWETKVKCMIILNCHVFIGLLFTQLQAILIDPLSVIQGRVTKADTFE